MAITQEEFEKLTRNDLERLKFVLDSNWNVCVRWFWVKWDKWESVLNWTVDPTTEWVDGDFYINTTSWQIFWPKTWWVWGNWTNLQWQLQTVVWWSNISIDNTDPNNPIINFSLWTDENFVTDTEKTAIWTIWWKEDVSNKSTNITTDWSSNTKYPSVKAVKDYADSLVVWLWDDRWSFDASSWAYPSTWWSWTAWAILKWDIWTISVAWTLPTWQVVEIWDTIRALIDTPWNTQVNWAIQQNNIWYTAENSTNKKTTMTWNESSNVFYLSAKAIYDWAKWLFVQLTGNQTVDWVKTFSSSPLVPTPTTDMEATTKKYVDEGLANKANDNAVVKLTGNQTITWDNLFTWKFNAKVIWPEGFLINWQIVTSVNSWNLTVAIKTLAWTDPSITDPVYCRIGWVVRAITSALSVTRNAWTNWFNAGSSELATKEIDYFVYLIESWGSWFDVCFARCSFFNTRSDGSNTTTNEKFLLWSWSPLPSTNKVVNIWRFSAILSAGTWYTWSTPSDWFQVINHHINESKWLDWVPTPWAIWSMTYSWVTYSYAKYKIVSNSIFFTINWTWTTWWTASKYISSTLPFTSNFPLYAWTVVNDWSWDIWGAILINNASNILYTCRYDWVNYWLWASRTIKGTNSYTI